MFTAQDMFIKGKGRLLVSLFSLFRVVNAQGPLYDRSELIRWLGESVLYPANLLPSPRMHWTAIDADTAKFSFTHKGHFISFMATFNEIGEIVKLETKRFMDKKHEAPWIILLSDYKKKGDVMIPVTTEVLWRLPAGDFSYAKFRIEEVEYGRQIED